MLFLDSPQTAGLAPVSCDPIVVVDLVGQGELTREPLPPAVLGQPKNPTQHDPKILPILDYYLTFIHYFGFSINPDDDTSSRILSIRVKRAAAFASSFAKQQQQQQQQQHSKCSSAHSNGTCSTGDWIGSIQAAAQQQRQQAQEWTQPDNRKGSSSQPRVGWSSRFNSGTIKLGVKLVAISLTSFLTMNHVIVLIDYIYQGSKVLTELMLELRLVITKLSALIFVISWHRNQSEVRQLIRLIRSTSVNILTSEQSCAPGTSGSSSNQVMNNKQPAQHKHRHKQCLTNNNGTLAAANCAICQSATTVSSAGDTHSSNRLTEMNGRILKWWIFCTSITITHLSLSEAEIKSAQHLWEWLDDYSLHQLSNETTSNETLFAMATFDNYMYTVHVYGTRLIGSSIICIVCTFQIENITCLTRQTLNLLRAYAVEGANTASTTTTMNTTNTTTTKATCANGGGVTANATGIVTQPSGHGGGGGTFSWPGPWTSCDCCQFVAPASPAATGKDTTTTRHYYNDDDDDESGDESDNNTNNGNTSGLLCRSLFYILGESDWIRVERNRRSLAPVGLLSAPVARKWNELSSWLGRHVVFSPKQCLRGAASGIGRGYDNCVSRMNSFGNFLAADVHGLLCRFGATNRVTPFWRAWAARSRADGAGASPAGAHQQRTGGGSSARHDDDEEDSGCSQQQPTEVEASATGGSNGPTPNGLSFGRPSIDRRAAPIPASNSNQLASKHREQAPIPLLRNYLDDYLARERAALNGTQATNNNNNNRHYYFPNVPPANQNTASHLNMQNSNNYNHDNHRDGQHGNRYTSGSAPFTSTGRGHDIEWHLDNLARKYELIRTVNLRIDSCFGHMLLSQYSFLFLMSCIDVVFFSLSFSPNTKTKYIIVSGMILLWLPYLLVYKYASDVGLASKKLLTSVRRLARLAFVLQLSSTTTTGNNHIEHTNHVGQVKRRRDTVAPFQRLSQEESDDNDDDEEDDDDELFYHRRWSNLAQQRRPNHLLTVSAVGSRLWERRRLRGRGGGGGRCATLSPQAATTAATVNTSQANNTSNPIVQPPLPSSPNSRARIFNKLDHVFEPSHLSIVGLMTMNKFFLLNFAKIVITASVMTIQFISKR